MQKQISSLQNPTVKKLLQLQEKSRTRKKEGLFVIEGQREIELAIKGGFHLIELHYCLALFSSEALATVLKKIPSDIEVTELTEEVYQKIAYR